MQKADLRFLIGLVEDVRYETCGELCYDEDYGRDEHSPDCLKLSHLKRDLEAEIAKH